MNDPSRPPAEHAGAAAWHGLVESLGLSPHPEGGYFRETYRSDRKVSPDDDRPDRSAITTIDFLLPEGTFSRWHRVQSCEVWHHMQGDALELAVVAPTLDAFEIIRLDRVGHGAHMHVVPAGWWQAARPVGTHALCACTVGPGFDFADFAFLADEPDGPRRLQTLNVAWSALL
jgi:predicted cupin superfamily sugar epimerase